MFVFEKKLMVNGRWLQKMDCNLCLLQRNTKNAPQFNILIFLHEIYFFIIKEALILILCVNHSIKELARNTMMIGGGSSFSFLLLL